jgi:hypothetical protein
MSQTYNMYNNKNKIYYVVPHTKLKLSKEAHYPQLWKLIEDKSFIIS